jgi:chemotaxis protein CheX
MLGMEVEEGSDDMKDAVGEMLNMVVGNAKTRYSSENNTFKVSVPTTIIGEDYTIHIKANASDKISLLNFNCNNDAMSIEVYLK